MADNALPPHYDSISSDAPCTNILPMLEALPPPQELLLRPPFHLLVEVDPMTKGQVTVQCSHQPSLSLLANYLERYCRVDIKGQSFCSLNIKFDRSFFAPPPFYDRIILTPAARIPNANVALAPILALVESLLGYDRVSSEALKTGQSFHFRRGKAFDNV